MIKRYRKLNILKKANPDAKGLPVSIAVSTEGDSQNHPATAIADTGNTAYPLVIPAPMLSEFGLSEADLSDATSTAQVGDGTEATFKEVRVNLLVRSDDGNITFTDVLAAVPPEGDAILIGMDILNFFNLRIAQGKIREFRVDYAALNRLEDWKPNAWASVRQTENGRRYLSLKSEAPVNAKTNLAPPMPPLKRPSIPKPRTNPGKPRPPVPNKMPVGPR